MWVWLSGPTTTPAQLSGGQQQRVAIARALVNSAVAALLAGRADWHLDWRTSLEVMALLQDLHREGMTIPPSRTRGTSPRTLSVGCSSGRAYCARTIDRHCAGRSGPGKTGSKWNSEEGESAGAGGGATGDCQGLDAPEDAGDAVGAPASLAARSR